MAKRGPLGHNSQPRKKPKWNPRAEPAPTVRGSGSVSRPTKPPRWSPKTLPQDAAPKIIQS